MRDFKQPDASKMSSKLLSDRMKYLKSTDEEVTKMCNIVEEYTAKRNAEVAAASRLSANIDNIKALMQTMHLSSTEAMDDLRVEETKRSQYMALL